jgi:hypothetical protein
MRENARRFAIEVSFLIPFSWIKQFALQGRAA